MNTLSYNNQSLFIERTSLIDIAKKFGTPTYVYSRAHIENKFKDYQQALQNTEHLICYAVKANSNIAILNLLAKLGAGFDIVSRGELERVLAAGGDANKVIFSGVGKTEDDIRRALEVGIYNFNVESTQELERIQHIASQMNKVAPISLRINPNIDAKTHPYISTGLNENKFGIDISEAEAVYLHAATLKNIKIKGVDCHIGSQLTTVDPFIEALECLLKLIDSLSNKGIILEHIDLGGGLGVCYSDEQPPTPKEQINKILSLLDGRRFKLIFEPGRYIVANAGVLITTVEYLKHTPYKNFVIIDAAMNDLIRPALYESWMDIKPVTIHSGESKNYDIVGPICESGDFLGKNRELVVQPKDLLAICSAGAYGFTMSSNYNSRGRAAEVIVDNDQAYLVRPRETLTSLFESEQLLPL